MKKIAVYAICKNEEKHVQRWYESVKDADGIFVLDTGSEDGTVDLLSYLPKVHVTSAAFHPFRFDLARNMALNQIPADYDYAVWLDLDEVFEPDWYNQLQAVLDMDPTAVDFRMVFHEDSNGGSITYNRTTAHDLRSGYRWRYPVHEVLDAPDMVPAVLIRSGIRVHHIPDPDKPRTFYLDLLRLAVQENPDDGRCRRYYARELMYVGEFHQAKAEYHLALRYEHNRHHRAEICIEAARCLDPGSPTYFRDAEMYLLRACSEAPDVRETWGDIAYLYFSHQHFHSAVAACLRMLDIERNPDAPIIVNEAYYREWPHHMVACCYESLGGADNVAFAKHHIQVAINMAPTNGSIIADLLRICSDQLKIK